MKKLALIAAAFAVMGMTESALADGPYIKGGIGYVGTNDTVEALLEDGQDFYNGAVGYDFGDVSAEIEYLYLPGSVDLHGVMLNAYYEIPQSDLFVTAGIGGVHPDAEGIDFDLHHITGAYQVGAGASVQVYGPVSVEPTVGYFSTWKGMHEGDIPIDFSGFYGNVSFKVAL